MIIETIDSKLLSRLFPEELTCYFAITHFEILFSPSTNEEYWLIDFVEHNELPNGSSTSEYQSKGFLESKLIPDFPLRGRAVYLRIKKRRWRHKATGKIIKRDYP